MTTNETTQKSVMNAAELNAPSAQSSTAAPAAARALVPMPHTLAATIKRAADVAPAALQVSPRAYALRALALSDSVAADAAAAAARAAADAAVLEYIAATDCMADEVPAWVGAIDLPAPADAITLESSRLSTLSDSAYDAYLAKCAERFAAAVDADQLSPAKSVNLVNKIAKAARAKVAACEALTEEEKHVLDVLRLVPYNKLVLADCLIDCFGRVVGADGAPVYGVRGVLASIRAKVAVNKRLQKRAERAERLISKMQKEAAEAAEAEKKRAERRAAEIAATIKTLVENGVEAELAAVLADKLAA